MCFSFRRKQTNVFAESDTWLATRGRAGKNIKASEDEHEDSSWERWPQHTPRQQKLHQRWQTKPWTVWNQFVHYNTGTGHALMHSIAFVRSSGHGSPESRKHFLLQKWDGLDFRFSCLTLGATGSCHLSRKGHLYFRHWNFRVVESWWMLYTWLRDWEVLRSTWYWYWTCSPAKSWVKCWDQRLQMAPVSPKIPKDFTKSSPFCIPKGNLRNVLKLWCLGTQEMKPLKVLVDAGGCWWMFLCVTW